MNEKKIILYCFFVMFGIGMCSFSCIKRIQIPQKNNSEFISPNKTEYSAIEKTSIQKKEFFKLAYTDSFHLRMAAQTKHSEIIYPEDDIDITIYEKLPTSQDKRTERKRVDADGTIVVVPIGKIQVVGLTIRQAQKVIEEKLSNYIISPICEIIVAHREYEPVVYVFGESQRNGIIKIRRGIRLLDVLSEVGGCKSDAYKRSIKVIRMDESEVVHMYSINLLDILNDGNLEENIYLQDQDIIYIPRRLLTNFSEVMTVLGSLSPWYFFIKNF